ncbi:MAG: DUF423 domain-containing protein [Chitinophagaceae bacterium]
MHKNYLTAAAIFGGLAVALGAFGAHALEKITTDPVILHGYQTAVQYQVYHALALLGVGILAEKFPGRWIKWAGRCFIAGIILFSGSLYLLTFLKIRDSTAIKFAGPITPIGGLLFMAGWFFLLVVFARKK